MARHPGISAALVSVLAIAAGSFGTPAVAESVPPWEVGFEAGAGAAFGSGGGASARGFAAGAPARSGSAFALASPGLEWIQMPAAIPGVRADARGTRSISSRERGHTGLRMLSAARARILLRSLTVPGWGQATLGRNGAAKVFLIAEAGVWASFAAFHIQEELRRQSYERTAHLDAGIDLRGRDEEYRRIVGGFLSSDSYNLYVVYRDAANLYYDDPVKYRAYIAEHELKGADAWHWSSEEDLLRYRAQRKDSQRAEQRANTAMALAIVNRFVSALHAARSAGRPAAEPRSLHLELAPAVDGDLLALRCGVRARF